MPAYTALNKAMAESGYVDAIDVEIFSGDEIVRTNIENIHAAGKPVVGSNHDFFKTPDKADLLSRLRKMQDLGAAMEYTAGFDGAMAEHGKELLGAGLIASGWANAIEEEMNQ